MRKTLAFTLSLAGACAAMTIMVVDAAAQARRDRGPVVVSQAPPLTIRQRSFLDPGPVVPVDSMRNYVLIGTRFNQPAWYHMRGRLGGESLPGRFEPGFNY